MTITLELSPEEVAILSDRAWAEGVDIATVLHGLIAQMAPQPQAKPELTEKQKGLVALLESWREEDKTDDPEELAERDRELEELRANLNRWRAEAGRPPADQ